MQIYAYVSQQIALQLDKCSTANACHTHTPD